MNQQKNWAGNLIYQAKHWYEPRRVEEIQQLVKEASHVRVVGSRHSFNDIADSDDTILSLGNLNRVLAFDQEKQTVTIEGGMRYGELSSYLEERGFALPNLASLPHISVAGACATATHGSGDQNQCLSSSVRAMKVVTANGEIVEFSQGKNKEEWNGAAVHLGALGVMIELTLAVIPSYQVRQYVYEHLPFSQFAGHLDEIFSSAYSVSLFTDWSQEAMNQVWFKQLAGEQPPIRSELYGALPARANSHPILGVDSINCTEQMGVDGPWFDRLPHFRLNFMPSSGSELQSEYLIPRQYAMEALQVIRAMRSMISPILHVNEIRSVAKDDFWLSPSYQEDVIGLHFTWKDNWEAVQQVLPQIEAALAPFQARPHWGKVFTMPKERVQSFYEKLPSFRQLLAKYDSVGKFRNRFINHYIF
ncbi:xylitol oxidase [Lederbergia galactosidilyticus]|uniref:FAD-binding protein n=1 Tax=Lederbergia galactosidilytica TaxID=217031 RepID=UPI001AE6C8A9|nr:FAD-binding protein [Lederbergia galactosidilytica]MBP1917409.1 xylitol oxidase [Lederbergia galactosidilytica]